MEEKQPETADDIEAIEGVMASVDDGAVSEETAGKDTPVADKKEEIPTTTIVERLVKKIEDRRAARKGFSRQVRSEFIRICDESAKKRNLKNYIPSSELPLLKAGIKENEKALLAMFEWAIEIDKEVESQLFYFRDFTQYYTVRKKTS